MFHFKEHFWTDVHYSATYVHCSALSVWHYFLDHYWQKTLLSAVLDFSSLLLLAFCFLCQVIGIFCLSLSPPLMNKAQGFGETWLLILRLLHTQFQYSHLKQSPIRQLGIFISLFSFCAVWNLMCFPKSIFCYKLWVILWCFHNLFRKMHDLY
jgi:hypothetical protein